MLEKLYKGGLMCLLMVYETHYYLAAAEPFAAGGCAALAGMFAVLALGALTRLKRSRWSRMLNPLLFALFFSALGTTVLGGPVLPSMLLWLFTGVVIGLEYLFGKPQSGDKAEEAQIDP